MKTQTLPRPDPATAGRNRDGLSRQLRFWRRSVGKHLWAIVLLAALAGVASAYVAYSIAPVYRATTTLFVEPAKSKVVSIEEVYGGQNGSRDHIQTQAEILKSREIAERLVKRLNLASHPAIDPRQAPPEKKLPIPWERWVPQGWLPAPPPPPSEEAATKAAIAQAMANLNVQLIRNSYMITLSFDSTDPKLAADAANMLARVYIEYDLEARLMMTQQAASWLTGRIKDLRTAVETSERALQQFRDKERIVDAKGIALGASSQLTTLTTALVGARQRVAELENSNIQIQDALKSGSRPALESQTTISRTSGVIRAKDAEAEAEKRWSELSKRYGAEHPKLIAAETELRSAREQTKKAVDAAAASITSEFEAAKATVRTMQASLDKMKQEIQDISGKGFQLAALERDVQDNRQLYDLFVGRFKETTATGDLQSTVARVVDRAVVPDGPIKPLRSRIITQGIVIGLILGLLLALLLEHLDNTVRSAEDVAVKLQSPLLGFLPKIRGHSRRYNLPLAFLEKSDPSFTESVRSLRTGLLMSALDTPQKVVLIASSVPSEGKTTVAINLAQAMAQVKRTCLIDADMRRPTLHRIMGIEANAPGLSSLVAGTDDEGRCIRQLESGLSYITSGPIPPNPLELLSTRRFRDVLAALEQRFDVIIIDSPPVLSVSDAVILGGMANAMVFVLRADSTPYQVAASALDLLSRGTAPLLGVVLNCLDLQKTERYYGYGMYASYGAKYAAEKT